MANQWASINEHAVPSDPRKPCVASGSWWGLSWRWGACQGPWGQWVGGVRWWWMCSSTSMCFWTTGWRMAARIGRPGLEGPLGAWPLWRAGSRRSAAPEDQRKMSVRYILQKDTFSIAIQNMNHCRPGEQNDKETLWHTLYQPMRKENPIVKDDNLS